MIEVIVYDALKAKGINVWTTLPDESEEKVELPVSEITLVNTARVNSFVRAESVAIVIRGSEKSEALAEAERIVSILEGLKQSVPSILSAVVGDLSYSYIEEPRFHAYFAGIDFEVRA